MGTTRDQVPRALGALIIIHPVPGGLNAGVVAGLALVARADAVTAVVLAVAMLGFQASIGALNDIVDLEADRVVKPQKPIPAGLVTPGVAIIIIVVGGVVGLAVSAGFGLAVLVVGTIGYGSGLAYDLALRRIGFGWAGFAVAFPSLLAWTWLAAAGSLPPGGLFLLALAALAGPMIHLANSLVDLDEDQATGATSLATQLGSGRAHRSLTLMTVVLYALAWAALLALSGPTPLAALAAVLGATLVAAVGLGLSGRADRQAREHGWLLQAIALGLFAVAWVASVTTSST